MSRRSGWLLLVSMSWAVPSAGFAQPRDSSPPGDPRSRSHVPIPLLEGELDPAELLREQIRAAQGLSDVRKLLEEILQQNNPHDPRVRQRVEELLRNNPKQLPSGWTLSEEQRTRLAKALKDAKLPSMAPKPSDHSGPSTPSPNDPPAAPIPKADPPSNTEPSAGPEPARRPPPDPQDRAAVAAQVRQWLTRLENTRGPLGNSPTVRRVVHDLARLGLSPEGRGGQDREGLETQLARLNRDVREAKALWEKSRSAFDQVRLPALPRLGWSSQAAAGLPPLTTSRVSVPEAPSSSVWEAVLWLSCLALFGLVALKFWSQYQRTQLRGPDAGWKLGPWPVPPDAVSTRADLVRAFEHLSLLLCGPAARSWNHREIAARLGGDVPERRQAADDLAAVYEQARYAPEQEPLPDQALTAARRDLCFLAGVAAA